ncbi:MAG: hypothetical protein WCI75_20905, partial [candidate division NC10 bacterium]
SGYAGVYAARSNGLIISGSVGVGGTSPKSKRDVYGGAVIGAYAGVTAAPSNGLIVSGIVGVGTISPLSRLSVGGGAAIGTYAGANAAPSNGLIVSGRAGVGTTSPLLRLDARGVNAKAATASFENIIEAASSDATDPLTLRMGIKTDAAPGNRYGGIEVDDAGTKVNLALQPTGGNVGIGTINPLSKLGVYGGAAIGSGYAGTYAAPSTGLIVQGKVGIGSTNPAYNLEVKTTSNWQVDTTNASYVSWRYNGVEVARLLP